ncbi:MAG: hypothetical protein QW734_09480 [Candidatus Bathyarchaeia archaeon]
MNESVDVERIISTGTSGVASASFMVKCPKCGFKFATPIIFEEPSKKVEIQCYKAKIEKFTDKSYRIYLFNALERGGDTEILVDGEIEIMQEIVEKDKRGLLSSAGFRKVDF